MQEGNEKLVRKKAVNTKSGLILYTKDFKDWKINYPDPEGNDIRYGNVTHERLAMFFLLLGSGHSLEEADEIAFKHTVKKRKK